ncbi:MAG: tetratricopeptide repeat protein [Gemmatimonadetes bacterium]|nr:tetratricopeptide repeat protein [Gemmatimonadota bacterium]
MRTPAPADLQRWSEELARNPASLAFLPLARAYRRLSRRDLALQLCQRGLEHHPTHVEAHALLALLHFESGDRARAADEWATVLRLKPGNFEALRGMGFRHLEQNDIARARQHLERAALIRPDDATVQEALRLIRARESTPRTAPPASAPGAPPHRRPRFMPDAQASAPASPPPVWGAGPGVPADPARLFDSMAGTGPLIGVLLLDRRGLVLAGSLSQGETRAGEEIGAFIGAAIDDAMSTVEHLQIGAWKGLLLESGSSIVHVSPVGTDAMVAIAARRGAPMGWVLRTAQHAVTLGTRFVEAYA